MKPLAVGIFILLACIAARWLCGRGLRLFILAPLLLGVFALNAFSADFSPPSSVLDPQNPLAPLAQFLGGALVTKILLWMGAIGAVAKLIAPKLQSFLESAIVAARANPDSPVTRFMDAVLGSPAWHVFVFLVDYFTRIKIPKSLAVLFVSGLVFLVSGCASQKTLITRSTEDGKVTEITRVATRTFFDSKSKLTDFKTVNSGGTNLAVQTVGIGSLSQSGSATNVVASLRIALELLEKLQGKP